MKSMACLVFSLMLVSSAVWAEEAVIPRFEIKAYSVEGNTILPSEELISILKDYTGPEKDFGTIQEAIEALESAYRKHGYSMVSVILPEQELERGTLIIRVLESNVKDITVEGNKHYNRDNILRALPGLRTGAPPKISDISENLHVANENPGRKLALQFKSGEKDTDLTAQIMVADKKPWQFTLSGDNTGSSSTGEYRTGLAFQHYNLFNRDHVIALQYITSPDHFEKVQIGSASYRLPLYRLGDSIDLFGAYMDVDSGTTQISGTDIKISGKGIVSGIRYNMTLPRSGGYEQKLVGGMDYRLYDNSALALNEELAKDILAHPLNLTYGGVFTSELATLDSSIGLLYNIPWGHNGEKQDFESVRNGASANYLIARYNLGIMIRPGADCILRISGTGQYTNDRLIPGEQFGLGGSTSIRGYQEREESWDNGISGTIELYSPDLAKYAESSKLQLRLVGFYDSGYGYNQRPNTGESSRHSLGGAGAGVRLGIGEFFNFSLDWGHALNNSVITKKGDNRIHFKASVSY